MAPDLIKVEIIERQTVKPSSPTPHSSRTIQLSVLDQMVLSHVYFPTLLFYSGNNNITGSGGGATSTDMAAMRMERDYCQHLIRSLAKTLTHFYPLAGRLSKGYDMIQCTDDGAEFVTARVKCSLSRIFEHPDFEMLTGLVPAVGQPDGDGDGVSTRLPLLAVQANLFECGGIAIGLNFSHKVVDGITASAFISCWAKTALDDGDDDQVPFMVPKFDAASYFPPLDFLNSSQPSSAELVGIIKQDKCITKRFVFDNSKIATLQSNLASAVAPHAPTRVLVVSALIWKCAMEASSKSSNIPPSSFLLTMDLRRWFEPPLPQNLAGNVVGILVVTATASLKGQEESNETIDLKDLVAKLSKGFRFMKPILDGESRHGLAFLVLVVRMRFI
ncbi:vinorine synthase-like [Prunus persica]|uniref:vinorine synthase-like n=1 Tax=Prunus persica TaxID=3760 RepID=UPI0009AB427A|nr:vinorine synthase-like [Prunus persica]